MEKQALVVIGHKDGKVYLQHGGTDGVPPNYLAWTPSQAREVAALLLTSAEIAEKPVVEGG